MNKQPKVVMSSRCHGSMPGYGILLPGYNYVFGKGMKKSYASRFCHLFVTSVFLYALCAYIFFLFDFNLMVN